MASGTTKPTTRRARGWTTTAVAAGGHALLLLDVVHAAGGVEHHVARVLPDLDDGQRGFDEHSAADPDWTPEVTSRILLLTLASSSLEWDYADLLTWTRTVEERIDRRGLARKAPRLGRERS
jgi:hypothetical protein